MQIAYILFLFSPKTASSFVLICEPNDYYFARQVSLHLVLNWREIRSNKHAGIPNDAGLLNALPVSDGRWRPVSLWLR